MNYSIKVILNNYKNRSGLQKVAIRVIYDRKIYYAETIIKVKETQFTNGAIKEHPEARMMNTILRQRVAEIEKSLLGAIQNKTINDSPRRIIEIIKGKAPEDRTSIENYRNKLIEQLTGKVSENRLRHLRSVVNKFTTWMPGVVFNMITVDMLNEFEAHIRRSGIDGNTVFANMKLLKSFLIKAENAGLIKEEQYKKYKVPSYKQGIPVYLTEAEIDKIHALVKVIEKPSIKTVGYYFLLSCLCGYRISDLMRFNYEQSVHGNNLVLRAKKNGEVVSIGIYLKLEIVLEYIKDHKLEISETHFRKYLTKIVSLCGIKKEVTPHSGRHSFAMMLMNKGFTVDEVAELLGDSELIAKVYARITNEQLNKKVKERLN